MEKPIDLLPVLAKIEHQNSLGLSVFFEVVYYNDTAERWESYQGSKTFDDGEKVIAWCYANHALLPNT